MHLKSLEIQGFKSFPDKTTLNFDANITAIVGPNGSGKSNISDAIRWVMGEQSTRALRGGKMEDVIFGGTEVRKSQGFTQVSLTLDNEDRHFEMDENEIMVTRRYYRSGESEYYINRQLVRLRDLNELFMDTGLGQEGYSLIGQGKIDEILSVKSTQRRQIFEEAAGISRYRHRKEEAERKLERTRENLLRISDKIEELELQVGPLKEQSEKAKRYFQCQEELRLLEVSLWMNRLEILRQQNRSAVEAYEAMCHQMEQVREETERLYKKLETLSQSVQDKEREMEVARADLRHVEEESAESDKRLSVLEERIRNNQDTASRLEEEQKAQLSRGEGLEQQLQGRREGLLKLEVDLASCQESIRAQEEQLSAFDREIQTLEQDRTSLLGKAQEESRFAQEMQSLISALGASSREIEEREAALEKTIVEVQASLGQCEEQEETLGGKLQALDDRLQEETKALEEERGQLVDQEKGAEEAEARWVGIRMEENNLSSRLRMLEDMEKLYEGYSKSVKTVMGEAKKGRLSGVHGPVAGLVKVPEAYTVAIEIALGGAMQNLVVESEQHGKAVLNYLKQHDAGRVTCLPLNTMRPGSLDQRQSFSQVEGYLGIASELIDYDPRYQNTISNLLGRVVIVRDLDSGIAMAKRYQYRFRIVTLDGQVLAPGGAMSGGSVNKKGGILSRAKELETLRLRQGDLETARRQAERELEEAKKRTANMQELVKAREEQLRQTHNQLNMITGQMEGQKAQTESLRRQWEQLQIEQRLLAEKTAEASDQQEKARAQIAQMEEGSRELEQALDAMTEQKTALQARRETAAEALGEAKTRLAMLETEKRVSQQSLEQLSDLRQSLTEDYERQGRDIVRVREETEQLLTQSAEEEAKQRALLEKKEGCTARLTQLGQEKLEMEGLRNQTDREGRSQNEALLYAQKEVSALEQKKLSGEQEEALLLTKMWETYEMTHEAALGFRVPIENRKETEGRVGSLKSEIRGLGNVNLGAVEEYERVSERYEYLLDQRRDVDEAREQLITIIEELTGEMKLIFKREFVRIEESFSKTFVELFQGGKASLELEDEEDILNCGIEIRVQPPGKSLKNLSLLSGGEKAFVAIALYFSILKIRPTPFCVLDEIEAALDDVNVVRFARYLRKISDKTQFIVITHRRGTMEESDMLYGVTMEQSGISKILHLNLNEAELAIKSAR